MYLHELWNFLSVLLNCTWCAAGLNCRSHSSPVSLGAHTCQGSLKALALFSSPPQCPSHCQAQPITHTNHYLAEFKKTLFVLKSTKAGGWRTGPPLVSWSPAQTCPDSALSFSPFPWLLPQSPEKSSPKTSRCLHYLPVGNVQPHMHKNLCEKSPRASSSFLAGYSDVPC